VTIEIYNAGYSENCGILFTYDGSIGSASWAVEAGIEDSQH